MLSRLAPARRRLVLVALGLLGLVVVAVGALAVVPALRSRAPAVDQSAPGPVLLVPGYGGSQESLAPLVQALRRSGRDVTVVTLSDRAQGDLDDQAGTVGAAVDAALERTGAASLDLVGYSAGGVVARLWVTEDGGAERVRRLVTLGSPHHGTEVATVGSLVPGTCPTACQQLGVDSPLLARLDATPLPEGVVFLSLWTTRDEVVVPPSSSVVEGVPSPSLQSICTASTARHGDLPGDRLAQSLLRAALGPGPLPSWSTADCARLSGGGG